MRKRVLISAVLLLALFGSSVCAAGFSYSAQIENQGAKKYKGLRLTPGVYNTARENLADVMVFNNGEAVPYFINSFEEKTSETQKTYEMKLINSFVKDEFFYYDYTLKNPPGSDVLATSIEVRTDSRGFAKPVELWGGYDNQHWEKVKDDILYRVEENQKLAIQFTGPRKYTHYRFKLANNLERISFTSVSLNYLNSTKLREYFSGTVTPVFTTEEKGKTTVINLQGLKNLKLDSVTLETDSTFKRSVSFEGRVTKVLYNLTFNNTSYQDLTLNLGSYRVASDTASITIDNRDDKPINVSRVQVRYLFDELVFDGSRPGDYSLMFGDPGQTAPKSYDIANYKDQVLAEGYDPVSLKDIKTLAEPEKPQYDYRWVFNLVITAVAVVLGIIIVFRLRKPPGDRG